MQEGTYDNLGDHHSRGNNGDTNLTIEDKLLQEVKFEYGEGLVDKTNMAQPFTSGNYIM